MIEESLVSLRKSSATCRSGCSQMRTLSLVRLCIELVFFVWQLVTKRELKGLCPWCKSRAWHRNSTASLSDSNPPFLSEEKKNRCIYFSTRTDKVLPLKKTNRSPFPRTALLIQKTGGSMFHTRSLKTNINLFMTTAVRELSMWASLAT